MEEERREDRLALALQGEEDLGEDHWREVRARGGIEDGDLDAFTDEPFHALEADIASRFRVVELSILITFDDPRHPGDARHDGPPRLFPRRRGGLAARALRDGGRM